MFQMSFKSYPIDHWLLPLFHLGLTLNTLWGHPPPPPWARELAGSSTSLACRGLPWDPRSNPGTRNSPGQEARGLGAPRVCSEGAGAQRAGRGGPEGGARSGGAGLGGKLAGGACGAGLGARQREGWALARPASAPRRLKGAPATAPPVPGRSPGQAVSPCGAAGLLGPPAPR